MENMIDNYKELETAESECSKRRERKKIANGEGNHGQLTPDDSDAKKIITKCNLTLV